MTADFADDVKWMEAAGTELADIYIGGDAVVWNVAPIAQQGEGIVGVDELHADGDVVFSVGTGTYRASTARPARS